MQQRWAQSLSLTTTCEPVVRDYCDDQQGACSAACGGTQDEAGDKNKGVSPAMIVIVKLGPRASLLVGPRELRRLA